MLVVDRVLEQQLLGTSGWISGSRCGSRSGPRSRRRGRRGSARASSSASRDLVGVLVRGGDVAQPAVLGRRARPRTSRLPAGRRARRAPQCRVGVERARQQLAGGGEEAEPLVGERARTQIGARARSCTAACCAAATRKLRSSASKSRRDSKLSAIAPNGCGPTASGITASDWKSSCASPSPGIPARELLGRASPDRLGRAHRVAHRHVGGERERAASPRGRARCSRGCRRARSTRRSRRAGRPRRRRRRAPRPPARAGPRSRAAGVISCDSATVSSWRRSASAWRRCSAVTSRAITEAPMTSPLSSRSGETLSEIFSWRPSLLTRSAM